MSSNAPERCYRDAITEQPALPWAASCSRASTCLYGYRWQPIDRPQAASLRCATSTTVPCVSRTTSSNGALPGSTRVAQAKQGLWARWADDPRGSSPLLARGQFDKGEAKPLGQRARDLAHHRVAQVAVQLAQGAQARRRRWRWPGLGRGPCLSPSAGMARRTPRCRTVPRRRSNPQRRSRRHRCVRCDTPNRWRLTPTHRAWWQVPRPGR